MSANTKLHVLLITTILGVALYMFLIYKEIKVFEREVADLRIKVHSIASQLPHPSVVDIVADGPQTRATSDKEKEQDAVIIANNSDDNSIEQDEDDNASVTSNEIKEILTNIQDIQEDFVGDIEDIEEMDCVDADAPSSVSSGPSQKVQQLPNPKIDPKITALKLADLSDDQISKISYDNLRAILRNHGVTNPRGTKADLVTKAIEVKNNKGVLSI